MYPRVLFLNLNVKESVFKERIFACIMLRFIFSIQGTFINEDKFFIFKETKQGC